METDVSFSSYHYTQQKNSDYSEGFPYTNQGLKPDKIKSFKVKIRRKLVYIIELYCFGNYAFIKFHPKIYENSNDKYKLVGMDLRIGQIRKLLNTCCKIILREIDKNEDPSLVYGLIGQWYEKDNLQKRIVTKRFDNL